MRKTVWMLFLIVATLSFADSATDKTTRALDDSQEELVKESFRTLVSAYLDKDIETFMEHVSEAKFQQDYITFEDAIREDFRVYNLLDLDYWFEQIVPDGDDLIYMKVRWHKEYESICSSKLHRKNGVSWFLFMKRDGTYKLIGMAGQAMWGESRTEWLQETPISSRKMR